MFSVNHIHLKAPDPKKTAQWYVDVFGAKVVGEGIGLGDSFSVRLDIEGTHINVTSAPAGESLPEGTSESHFGLEHFGFDTDNIEDAMAHVQSHGAEVLLPITQTATGSKISYIKGPDNVRIELVQPAA
jgi:catechol 2,3-dioxygenase-like lactoylglutathione lyase family enzyme